MNVALMGSVSSSWCVLKTLIQAEVKITAVLGVDESRADRISDYRSLRCLAEEAGIPFLSFIKVNEPKVEEFLRAHPPDLLWVIGFSQLVPDSMLKIARHGSVGYHPTMLPEGRGRAPIVWTILRQARAAVNLFYLTDEPDAGDIIIQRKVPVLPNDYAADLIARMDKVLAEAVTEIAPHLKADTLPRTPQDHGKATYYPKRTPADGLIDWSQPTADIYRLIRAVSRPYPGAFAYLGERKLLIWRARPATSAELDAQTTPGEPGTVIASDPGRGVLVRTTDAGLWLTEIEFEPAGSDNPKELLRPGDHLTGREDDSA